MKWRNTCSHLTVVLCGPRQLSSLRLVMIAVIIGLGFGACDRGKRPFALARVCLPTQRDVPAFLNEIRHLGAAEHMEFFDRTSATKAEREALNKPSVFPRNDGFVLNVGVLRRDGMGVTTSELGGPGFQVGLGFSEGSNPAEARRFEQAIISKLRQRWYVEVQSGDTGLQPLARCGD